MRKLKNIRLKNIDAARAHAIFAVRCEYGLSLAESKSIVDKILAVGEIEATYVGYEWGSHRYEYNFDVFYQTSVEQFENLIRNAFDYELEKVDRPSNENMREPCEDTKKALAWLETLTEEQKDMVKLIGDWEHPVTFYAAVC